jgi:hypothetical protein
LSQCPEFASNEVRAGMSAQNWQIAKNDHHPGDKLALPQNLPRDVAGMEMDVLAGLAETIRSFRPAVLVEIADRNAASARAYFSELSYEGVFESRDYYQGFTNVLFIARKSKPSV